MAESSSGGSSKEISLSVDETNRLRATLGLKPLQVENSSNVRGRIRERPSSQDGGGGAFISQSDGSSASDAAGGGAAELLASARLPGNGDAAAAAAHEEKRRAARLQRERTEELKRKAVHTQLTKGLTVAEQQQLEDEDCDPAAWIARMRRKEAREKVVLASQGKLDVARYDDSDEEEEDDSSRAADGRREDIISTTSEKGGGEGGETGGASLRKRGRGEISGRDVEETEADEQALRGIRVVHGLKDFEEGEEVILTLKDTRILTEEGDLNEDGDALESLQLVEKQRLQKRLKAKERRIVYDPTAEEEENDGEEIGGGGGGGEGERGKKIKREILKHYDEWEEERLEAQGKKSQREEATGFILPDMQQRGALNEMQVPLHRLQPAGSMRKAGRSRGAAEERDMYLPGANGTSNKRGLHYNASGPSAIVLGEEVAAPPQEEAERVAFRKLPTRKISKKKHGTDFWKNLFGEGVKGTRSEEEDAEEGEANRSIEDDDSTAAAQRGQRKDRHHGSRKNRVAGGDERKEGAQQKQGVRDALERAAEMAHKRNSSDTSSLSSSYSSARSKGEQRKNSESANLRESVEEASRQHRSFEEAAGGQRPAASRDPPEDVLLVEEDRLLREQLERQRRLARAKLQNRGELRRKSFKEDDDDGEQHSLANGNEEKDQSLLFKKLPQARILELMNRAQKAGAALIDVRPTDAANSVEPPQRNAGQSSSSVQQQNVAAGAGAASAGGIGSVGPSVKKEEEAEEEEGGGLQISTTTEFCRTVQTPLEKLQTMKQEVFAGARLFRQQKAAQTHGRGERGSKQAKGESVEAVSASCSSSSSSSSSVMIGAGGGLKRTRKGSGEREETSDEERREAGRRTKKGERASVTRKDVGDDNEEMEIDAEKTSAAGEAEKEKQAKDEEDADDDDEDHELGEVAFMNETPMGQGIAEALKYLQSKNHYSLDKMRQRRHRPDELPLHKPVAPNEIKLDHRDMYGNVMTPKDAFRFISWRFHGKYPSLKKQEKKARKVHLERKLLKNPMEALPTLNALQKLQQTEKTFHMVLTGNSLGDGGGSR